MLQCFSCPKTTLLIGLQLTGSGKHRLSQDGHAKTGLGFSVVTVSGLLRWHLCLIGCPGASIQSRAVLVLIAALWVSLSF